MLEEILDIRNVQKALRQVTANRGAGGIDGMQWGELRDYLNAHWQTLREDILEGNYKPQPVRKVEIPKPGGGTRMLGDTYSNRQAFTTIHCTVAQPEVGRRIFQL
jgi:RNA-directed DNA polymerase